MGGFIRRAITLWHSKMNRYTRRRDIPPSFFYAFMQIRMGDMQFHVVRYRAAFAGSRRSGYCHKRRIGQINSLVLKYS